MTQAIAHKKTLLNKNNILILTGIIIFLLALILHPWDQQWKNFVLKYNYLQSKGTILRAFLGTIVIFGKGACMALFILVIAASGFRKKAMRIFIAILLMTVIVWPIKLAVHRERPNHENHVSFPSGDTATASAFLGAVAVQNPILAPVYIIAPAVGFCRTYSNWHYLSDVVAGIACGIIAVGIAGYVRFKKLKLIENIKPRYFGLAIIVMLFATFLPNLIEGGGSFLDFFSFYGPATMIFLVSRYSTLFVFRHTAKDSIFAKLFRIKRKINDYLLVLFNKYFNKLLINKISAVIFIIIPIIMLYFSWTTIYLQKLRLPTSGLALAILVTVYLVNKQYSNPKNKRTAVQTLINSIILIIFFFLIIEIPAVCRNNSYYKKIGKPQYSIIKHIF